MSRINVSRINVSRINVSRDCYIGLGGNMQQTVRSKFGVTIDGPGGT